MRIKVYRSWARLLLLTGGLATNAVIFTVCAIAFRQHWPYALLAGLLATATAGLAARLPFARVVASTEGLTIHTAIKPPRFIAWADIRLVWPAETEPDAGLIRMYAPQLSLAEGRGAELTLLATYRWATSVRHAGELDVLRQQWSPTGRESVH